MDKKKVLEYIKSIFYALCIAFIFRSFAFEAYKIPSSSMEPTLLIHDRLFVSKYSYGYSKYSFMPGIPVFDDIMEAITNKILVKRAFLTNPKRGDIIVFRGTENDRKSYIKRLIGLPGDIIIISNNDIYINGNKIDTKEIGLYEYFNHSIPINLNMYNEFLPESKPHIMVHNNTNKSFYSSGQGRFEVPSGHYFMMGDNRDFSNDSRFDIGMVPEENLIGRADFRFWTGDVLSNLLKAKIDDRWLKLVQ